MNEMEKIKAVVNTDQVNKQMIRVPLAALVNSIEEHTNFSVRHGLPLGSPSYIAHDTTRLAGWTSDMAVILSSDIGRQTAFIYYPDSAQEKKDLEDAALEYTRIWRDQRCTPFVEELRIRTKLATLNDIKTDFSHCAVISRENLAADLYPDIFDLSSDKVDKAGLTFYSRLIENFSEVQPGIFHDPDLDLLLFAHAYFRRSFSRRNSLNQYFLRGLSEAAKNPRINARIRLDPNLIGHPKSLQHHLEFEYWHGPIFTDDIESIPSGVAVHKADELTRFFESVDKTNLWWKQPESRIVDGEEQSYRTFEAEELVEEPSADLGSDVYGCRYVHAEYAVAQSFLSHFDGAIRTYPALSFMERIEKNIDRAGKHSFYSKLFRLDGDIPVSLWKSLVVNFFKGNKLLPEYFGFKESSVEANEPESNGSNIPDLAALISFDKPETYPVLRAVADESCPLNGNIIECLDFNRGACGSLIGSLIDLSGASLLICQDKTINVPRIILGSACNIKTKLAEIASALATALTQDTNSDLIERASIAISWTERGVMTSISIAGKALAVANLLSELHRFVEPSKPVSDWVDTLNERVKALAPKQLGSLDPLPIVSSDGRLRLKHYVDESLPAELLTQDVTLHSSLTSSANSESNVSS